MLLLLILLFLESLPLFSKVLQNKRILLIELLKKWYLISLFLEFQRHIYAPKFLLLVNEQFQQQLKTMKIKNFNVIILIKLKNFFNAININI